MEVRRTDEGVTDGASGRRAKADGAATATDQVERARQRHVDVHRTLILVDIEVRAGGGQRARVVRGLQRDRLIGVRDNTGDQRDIGAGEGDGLRGRRREAPGVGGLRAGQGAGDGPIVIVARGGCRRRDVRAGELADGGRAIVARIHLTQAPLVRVGREGRAIRDRPSADDAVDQVGLRERRAVDVGQEDAAGGGQARAAEGIDAGGVIRRGPTVEVDHGTGLQGADEVRDDDLVGAAFIDERLRVEVHITRVCRDGAEGDVGVDAAAAADVQQAAIDRDRGGRADAGRVGRGV